MSDETAGTALLLVDLQRDYFAGGPMELVGMETASRAARRVLDRFRERGWPRVHVQHLSLRPGASFFLPGTEGAEIHPEVAPEGTEPVVEKHFPNAFRETGLAERLRGQGVQQLVIVGAMSHMCIDASTRAAADLGFACTVIEDACATRDLSFGGRPIAATEVHGAFMAALGGAYARVTGADDFLAGNPLPSG